VRISFCSREAPVVFKRIIPCLDVKDGRVVKGVQFTDLVDAGDPAEQAAHYDRDGADEICFLDISATLEGRGTLLDIVARTADRIRVPLTVGGGVQSVDDVRRLLEHGADKVSINSAAVKDPDLIDRIAKAVGSQCLVVAIDAKKGLVHTRGGKQGTDLDAIAWAREAAARGAGEILLTSMDRDGTKSGYDLELTKFVADAVTVPVIASGGAGSIDDIADALQVADAALAASIFHFREHTVLSVRAALAERGIAVRP
jgi:imidazole glycerol-phosphate synthase subunit HisF